jgi:hypothetical protein
MAEKTPKNPRQRKAPGPTPEEAKDPIRYTHDGKPITLVEVKEGLVGARDEVIETLGEPVRDIAGLYMNRVRQGFRGLIEGLSGKEDGK